MLKIYEFYFEVILPQYADKHEGKDHSKVQQ